MAYREKTCKTKCGNCGAVWGWKWREPNFNAIPKSLECKKCNATNVLKNEQPTPYLPPAVYLGHEKNRQLKILATPVGEDTIVFPPYSIRSFVRQAADDLGRCAYRSSKAGEVLGEYVFRDLCAPAGEDYWYEQCGPCHFVGGFIRGKASCELWDAVKSYCQTENECRFLHTYLSLVKDRQFPMMLPQVRVGIAERRRPDFVAFVPLQAWRYRWYAVQLDRAHSAEMATRDRQRDDQIELEGYEVISLGRTTTNYLNEAKALVERFDLEMKQVNEDHFDVAIEIPVKNTMVPSLDDDIPF